MKGVLNHPIGEEEESSTRQLLIGRLWADLPEDVKALTEDVSVFLESIGARSRSGVRIGPIELDGRALWGELAKVLDDGSRRALKTRAGHEVAFGRVATTPVVFSVRCPELGVDARMQAEELELLSESLERREAAVRRNWHWFDVGGKRREEIVTAILAGQDASARLEAANGARERSAEAFYRELAGSLREGSRFRARDAVPTVARILVDHLRIDPGEGAVGRWERSGERLLADVGVVETGRRLGGLPVAMPEKLVAEVRRLAPGARNATMRALRRGWADSPVGLVHIGDVTSRVWGGERAAATRQRLADVLCDERRRPVFDAWQSVLRWVEQHFGFDEGVRELPREVRLGLVWVHADRVFRVLMARGLAPEWITDAFEYRERMLTADFVFPAETFTGDIAAPGSVSAEALVLGGLGRMAAGNGGAADCRAAVATAVRGGSETLRARVVAGLMADDGGAENALGSWLSGKVEPVGVLPEAMQEQFGEDALKASMARACAGIEKREEEELNWCTVFAVLGHGRAGRNTVEALERCLRGLDLQELGNRNGRLLGLVLHAIARHAGLLQAGFRRKMLERLVALGRRLADLGMAASERERVASGVWQALIGCAWNEGGEDEAAALAGALEQVASGGSSGVLGDEGRLVRGLCEELPLREAKRFWRLRERLRLENLNWA